MISRGSFQLQWFGDSVCLDVEKYVGQAVQLVEISSSKKEKNDTMDRE